MKKILFIIITLLLSSLNYGQDKTFVAFGKTSAPRWFPISTTVIETIYDIQLKSASPYMYFIDTDGADNDVSATIDVNLTDTGSGTEDADIQIYQKVAGSLLRVLLFDADVGINLYPLGESGNPVAITTGGAIDIPSTLTVDGGITNWADPQKGYIFDGTNDVSSTADDANLDFGTCDFSLEVHLKINNITDANQFILNKEAGGVGYGLEQRLNDLWIRFDDDNADATAIIGTDVFVADEIYHIIVTFDRDGNATAYINGVSAGTVDISGSPLTVDNTGAYLVGSTTAGANFFAGEVYNNRPFNALLTQASVANLFNNGDPQNAEVPFEYRWGGQTEKILNGDFPSATTNWGTTRATLAVVSGELQVIATDDVGYGHQVVATVVGKKYRLAFDYWNTVGDGAQYFVHDVTNSKFIITNVDLADNNSVTSISPVEFIATGIETRIALVSKFDTDITYFDNVSVLAIGAVASYTGSNAIAATWYDESDNDLDGTTAGSPQVLNEDIVINPDVTFTNDVTFASDVTVSNDLTVTGEIGAADFVGAITNTIDDNDNYVGLTITNNDVTNNPIATTIVNAGTGDGLFIDQNGDGKALKIDSESTNYNAIDISAKYGIGISQDVSGGWGMYIARSIAEAGTYPLVVMKNNNATDTQATLELQNDGSGAHITTGGTNEDLEIDPNGSGATDLIGNIYNSTTTNGDSNPVNNYMTVKVYMDSTIAGELTLSNVLPQGYVIDNIIFKNTTANEITNLDIGFTDAGGQIVAAANVTASDEGSFTVLQRIDDFDAADDVYISAANWNGANLIIYFKMTRMF